MAQKTMPETPECDRMVAVAEDSHKIGEFLDWLAEQGIHLCSMATYTDTCNKQEGPLIVTPTKCENPRWWLVGERKWQCQGGRMIGHPQSNKPGEDSGPCDHCGGTGEIPLEERLAGISEGPERLLARYFEIDLALVETERRAILAALRS